MVGSWNAVEISGMEQLRAEICLAIFVLVSRSL